MVGVGMGDAHDIEVVAPDLVEIAAECLRQVAALVVLVILATHRCVVDEDLATVGQIEPCGIGVAEREKVNLSRHVHRPFGSIVDLRAYSQFCGRLLVAVTSSL